MSYDLTIYSPSDQKLSFETLRTTMCPLGWEIRAVDYLKDTVLSKDISLALCQILGWDRTYQPAEELAQLFSDGYHVDFASIPERMRPFLIGCEYDVRFPTVFSEVIEDDEWWEELQKSLTAEFGARLQNTKSVHALRTAASPSPLRLVFQYDLAWAIAQITDGLVQDPQDGEEPFQLPEGLEPEKGSPIDRIKAMR